MYSKIILDTMYIKLFWNQTDRTWVTWTQSPMRFFRATWYFVLNSIKKTKKTLCSADLGSSKPIKRWAKCITFRFYAWKSFFYDSFYQAKVSKINCFCYFLNNWNYNYARHLKTTWFQQFREILPHHIELYKIVHNTWPCSV